MPALRVAKSASVMFGRTKKTPEMAKSTREPSSRADTTETPEPCESVTLRRGREDRLAAAHRRIVELGGVLTDDDNADLPTQTHQPGDYDKAG